MLFFFLQQWLCVSTCCYCWSQSSPSVGPLSITSHPLSPPIPHVPLNRVSPSITTPDRYFKSNTVFKFLPGTHLMNRPLEIRDVLNISLEAVMTIVTCTHNWWLSLHVSMRQLVTALNFNLNMYVVQLFG